MNLTFSIIDFLKKQEGTEVWIKEMSSNGSTILFSANLSLRWCLPCLPSKKNIGIVKKSISLFLKKEFEPYGTVYVATEDGSVGTKGNVLDAIAANQLDADIIYACGPTPMLRALKQYAKEQGMECYISLEEKMACGIGACLACVCKSKEVDEHTHVHNKRICKDGPVFAAEEVEL